MTDIREFVIEDYGQALALWQTSGGVGLSDADSRPNIARFLERNPGMSWVAVNGASLVGTVLCGHDGRRGLIHHLVVTADYQRQGLGRALVSRALAGLRAAQIGKCHLLVFKENESGRAFWESVGAQHRVTLSLFSIGTKDLG